MAASCHRRCRVETLQLIVLDLIRVHAEADRGWLIIAVRFDDVTVLFSSQLHSTKLRRDRWIADRWSPRRFSGTTSGLVCYMWTTYRRAPIVANRFDIDYTIWPRVRVCRLRRVSGEESRRGSLQCLVLRLGTTWNTTCSDRDRTESHLCRHSIAPFSTKVSSHRFHAKEILPCVWHSFDASLTPSVTCWRCGVTQLYETTQRQTDLGHVIVTAAFVDDILFSHSISTSFSRSCDKVVATSSAEVARVPLSGAGQASRLGTISSRIEKTWRRSGTTLSTLTDAGLTSTRASDERPKFINKLFPLLLLWRRTRRKSRLLRCWQKTQD